MAISIGTGSARATLFESTTLSDQYESNLITPDTETDSLVVALISAVHTASNQQIVLDSLTFGTASRTFGTGTTMTVELNPAATLGRTHVIIAWLKTDAAGTVQVDATVDLRGMIIDVIQFKGVDQASPVPTNTVDTTANTSGNNIALTTVNDNSWLVAVSASLGNDTGPPNSTNGTNLHQGSTGGSSNSDVKDAASYRAIATAGGVAANFTWSGSTHNIQGAIEVKEAAAGGPLDLNRISSMHFMRHYEPISMGE